MDSFPTIILASASPRRSKLLQDAGIPCTVVPADIDEGYTGRETPATMVKRLAREKAEAISRQYPGEIVLGADTVVFCRNTILGKPNDAETARAMIKMLSGRTHHVYTGVCLLRGSPDYMDSWSAVTHVGFWNLTDQNIRDYLAEAHPYDKSGGYAIQEHGHKLVAHVDGLVSTVVGLPIEEVVEHLRIMLAGGPPPEQK